MASRYGGDAATFPTITRGLVAPGTAVTFWTAATGGSQVTGLNIVGGASGVSSVTSRADGSMPEFDDPANHNFLWADAGGAERVKVFPDPSATFVGRNAADPGNLGGYWYDDDTDTQIARVRDRMFVGGGADFSGNYSGSDNTYLSVARWIPRESMFYGASSKGRIGVAGISRANNSPVSPAGSLPANVAASIGVVGFCYQDKLSSDSTRAVNGWGGYFEAARIAGAQAAFGVEIDIGNLDSASVANGPYNMYGIDGTFGFVMASGGSLGLTYHTATFGIAVTNNGADFKTGLIFQKNAIAGTDGSTGTGIAVDMAKGHTVQWSTPESTGLQGATLFSSVAATANKVGQEFTDNIVKFSRVGATITSLEHGGGASATANYWRLLSSATGGALICIAGSDTNPNVDMTFRPKGTGLGQLAGGSAGAGRVGWNDTGLGFFGVTPIARPTLPAAGVVVASDIRTALINLGLCQ